LKSENKSKVGIKFIKIVLCCPTLILNEQFWFVDL
jgi:hypothetical protein